MLKENMPFVKQSILYMFKVFSESFVRKPQNAFSGWLAT